MEIKRETVIKIYDSNKQEMRVGNCYVFENADFCFTGEYLGMSKRGALMFKSVIADSVVTMNVMPKSINTIVPVTCVY